MPSLLFILIVVLVATFGFWDTLQAVLGGVLVLGFLVLVSLALAAALAVLAFRRFRNRL